MKRDAGLDTLLDLHGTEYREANGYWYKIEARKVEATPERPHGIRYNLTLHDDCNQRILGFDNAHSVKTKKGRRYSGRIVEYDHIHETLNDLGTPFEFVSAEQLMKEFFERVNTIIKSVSS